MNKKAFSLIELSIVLIIIGLLVAGIVGGASLIEMSKVYSLVSTMRQWETDINAFYSLNGRLPGNPLNKNYLGDLYSANWGKAITASPLTVQDFGIDRYGNKSGSTAVSTCTAIWLDLYLSKISFFKPNENYLNSCAGNKNYPEIFNEDLVLGSIITAIFDNNNGKWPPFKNKMNGVYIQFRANPALSGRTRIKAKIYYNIDKKIDDGLYNNGGMRSFCYSSRVDSHSPQTIVDYQTAMDSKYFCYDFYLKMMDI